MALHGLPAYHASSHVHPGVLGNASLSHNISVDVSAVSPYFSQVLAQVSDQLIRVISCFNIFKGLNFQLILPLPFLLNILFVLQGLFIDLNLPH